MNEILALKEKRAKVWEAAKTLLESRRKEDGTISAEDAATYEKMEGDVVALGKEIDRLERQAALDLELSKPTSEPITNKPGKGTAPEEEKTGRASDLYKREFWNAMRKKNYVSVQNALQEGTDSEGGYLVPDEFEHRLVQALEEENVFRRLATRITTSSGDRKIPVVTGHGTAAWIDEEQAYPESDETFGQVSISAYKLATMIKISDELLNDSAFNLESYIATEFGRRIGAKEEEAFLVGDGTGKPIGLFNPATTIERVAPATAGKITFDDMMDLYHALRRPYRTKAKFIMNDSTIKAIRKLKDKNDNYIWQPSVQAGVPDKILNCEVVTSAYAPELGAEEGAIAFGDYSYYWIADRQGRSFKRLNELFAATGQVGFLASQRVDGKIILPEAVKILS